MSLLARLDDRLRVVVGVSRACVYTHAYDEVLPGVVRSQPSSTHSLTHQQQVLFISLFFFFFFWKILLLHRLPTQALDVSKTKLSSRLLVLLVKQCLTEDTAERLSPATCLKRLDTILELQNKSSYKNKRFFMKRNSDAAASSSAASTPRLSSPVTPAASSETAVTSAGLDTVDTTSTLPPPRRTGGGGGGSGGTGRRNDSGDDDDGSKYNTGGEQA